MYNKTVSITETLTGSISALACLCVILTYIFFSEIRKLRYVELVFYIALNDFVASIGISLGSQNNNSFACYFQAIATNLCYLSSCFWTTVITFQVKQIVYSGKILKDLTPFHAICWGLPMVLTFLPLFSISLGRSDDDSPSWCFITNPRPGFPQWIETFWMYAMFLFWMWLSVLINLFLLFCSWWRLKSMAVVSSDVKQTISKLAVYPIVITFC
jgi:hypothetical protein